MSQEFYKVIPDLRRLVLLLITEKVSGPVGQVEQSENQRECNA